MSNDLNSCNFIGRLGKDPEVRYAPNGDAFCSFSIAVGWKSKDKEGAEWVNIVTNGKLAEICGEYLKKGKQVYINGRMTTRKYDDKDGITRYSTEIRADRMQMLGGNDGNEQQRPARSAAPAAPKTHGQRLDERRSAASTGFDDMADDMIPF